MRAPLGHDEAERLEALHALEILDTSPEPAFDALVRAASLVCAAPIALISLIDAERQWFKANLGLPGVSETPRDQAFCAHAILGEDILEVPDATADPRFADNPLVTGIPDIRFYAGAPIRMKNGSAIGTLCVIDRDTRQLDETQREILRQLALAASATLQMWQSQRASDALRASRDEARQAARVKSNFLAKMSHEIRSPLSGLIGVLGLLRSTTLDAEQTQMLGMIDNSASTTLAVLNDILDFSKIEADAVSILPEPTALHERLRSLVQPHVIVGKTRGIDVTLAIDEDVPKYVDVDSLRLSQILGNLISNAMKFTAQGRVSVHVGTSPDAAASMLLFTVSDTGIGIREDGLERLFQPFTQADNSITRKFGGTGLGLSISRQLASLMGGGITAVSTPGVGSTFTLKLACPACVAPAVTPPDNVAVAAVVDHAVPVARRVLVVDDDKTNRWLLQRQLQKLGFVVDTAEDGEAGLAAALANPFDLIITDCHMPGMDGAALTRTLRASAKSALRSMPIIGLTADTTDAQRLACRAAGMTELAIKPLRVGQLSDLISRLL